MKKELSFNYKVHSMPINPVALYIHWPFCTSKCPYCDFNSHVLRSISEDDWIVGIEHELRRYHSLTAGRPLKSIFFGGGTPSLMSPEAMARVIDLAKSLWGSACDGWGSASDNNADGIGHSAYPTQTIEITMEANPGSVEAARFEGYRDAGVNRLSLGVQALNDKDLKTLGRQHSAAQALKALDIAQKTFDRVSLDLIYARPAQTLAEWEKELSFALTLGTTHMSLYQLTIEAGTAFAPMHARGELVIPKENEATELYLETAKLTEAAGFIGYETSNYAQPGYECLHNLAYWQYDDYIGVGPGAHGRLRLPSDPLGKVASQQVKAPKPWLECIEQKGRGDDGFVTLDLETQFQEQLMMGLRLRKGIRTDALLRPWTEAEQKRLAYLQAEGLLACCSPIFQLTAKGALVLNSILHYLLCD